MIQEGPNIIVGISQRIDSIIDRVEYRDSLDEKLIQLVVEAGFLPVAIPNMLMEISDKGLLMIEMWLDAVQPSAFILSGGNNIGDYVARDNTERYLLSRAKLHRMPVLGICRGLQMMAVWSGVDLVKRHGHVGVRHDLSLKGLTGDWPKNVNSFHNWSLVKCPDEFEIVAESKDGSIEAIRHTDLPWEGWMWHPERETPFAYQDLNRLKALFRKSSKLNE